MDYDFRTDKTARFDVITMNWPAKFVVYSEDTGEGRSAQAHYDTKGLTWDDYRKRKQRKRGTAPYTTCVRNRTRI